MVSSPRRPSDDLVPRWGCARWLITGYSASRSREGYMDAVLWTSRIVAKLVRVSQEIKSICTLVTFNDMT